MNKTVMLVQLINGPCEDMEVEYVGGEVSFTARMDSRDYMSSFSFNIAASDLIAIADYVKKSQEND